MKILDIDEKLKKISLKITNIDDLWFLNNFLEKGDIIFGLIFRKEEERQDTVRSKKTERIRIRVGIEIDYTEFQDFSNRLRVHGIIKIGPEDFIGFHQSLNIETNYDVEIIKKEWKKFYIEELKKAEDSGQVSLFISMDDENATIALLRDYAIQILAEIKLKKKSKDIESKEEEINYSEIMGKLKQYWEENMPVILAGPGFFKENFFNFIPESEILKKHIVLVNTSYAGERGIYEALKSGTLDNILKKQRLMKEFSLVNELLEEIGKNGKYAYGMDEVKKAIEYGAVEKLLVTDIKIKDENILELMKEAESQNAQVHIISSHHEYGRILQNLGGIGALLRYPLPNRP
ncbi:MAG: mRNA surveillance protein pelota [Thermoplasmata archaeon]